MKANKKLGQEPAYPIEKELNYDNYGILPEFENGMSKRFYATCAAMQGLLTNEIYMSYMAKEYREKTNKAVIEDAYEIADELLKQELL